MGDIVSLEETILFYYHRLSISVLPTIFVARNNGNRAGAGHGEDPGRLLQ
jgi:hypothetical protein